MRLAILVAVVLISCGGRSRPSLVLADIPASDGFLFPWDGASKDLLAKPESIEVHADESIVAETGAGDMVELDLAGGGLDGPAVPDDAATLDTKGDVECRFNEDCDDLNPCTDDKCGPAGCLHTFNQASCDDGNPCTKNDTCLSGKCVGTSEISCDDGDPCTDDKCKPGVGCLHDPIDCDDHDPCTQDFCKPDVGCVHANTDGPCDDGNPCTTGDRCVEGICQGLADMDCDDDDPCTVDYCDPINACVHDPIPNCEEKCTKHSDCDDGDECTADLCNPALKLCEHVALPTCEPGCSKDWECDDGDECTADVCIHNVGCVHVPVEDCEKQCWTSWVCKDNDPCTYNWCDYENHHCVSLPKPVCEEKCQSAADCDDGDPCTVDVCVYVLSGMTLYRCWNIETAECGVEED